MITIQIALARLNIIKANQRLATSVFNTFLTVDSKAIFDVNGQPVTVIADGEALPVQEFREDQTRPFLLFFSLDLNEGALSIQFNEPINSSSVDVTGIGLCSSRNCSESYSLTGGYALVPDPSTSVEVIVH